KPRCRRPMIGEVDDQALLVPVDRAVRLIDETLQPFGKPVIAASLLRLAIHPLLNDHPAGVVADDETMEIELESVLDGGAVDLGDQPARSGERCAIETDALADR